MAGSGGGCMLNFVRSCQVVSQSGCCCSVTKLCLTLCNPWTVAHQAPLSRGFLRQEYWSGLPFPSPGDPPFPGIELSFPALTDRFTAESPGEPRHFATLSGTYASSSCSVSLPALDVVQAFKI